MYIIPAIIVTGVSLLFVATAVAPMVIEILSERPARPKLTVMQGGLMDTVDDHRPNAA